MTISFSPHDFERLRCTLHPKSCGISLEPSRTFEALHTLLDGIRAAHVAHQVLLERHVSEVKEFVRSLEHIDNDLSTRLV